ncbi:hypothetical protein BD414DRAFT_321737 [Trametes punicea]|nr:hypothetical protein BD414DRAFT_321737 [Trametes punicea]
MASACAWLLSILRLSTQSAPFRARRSLGRPRGRSGPRENERRTDGAIMVLSAALLQLIEFIRRIPPRAQQHPQIPAHQSICLSTPPLPINPPSLASHPRNERPHDRPGSQTLRCHPVSRLSRSPRRVARRDRAHPPLQQFEDEIDAFLADGLTENAQSVVDSDPFAIYSFDWPSLFRDSPSRPMSPPWTLPSDGSFPLLYPQSPPRPSHERVLAYRVGLAPQRQRRWRIFRSLW